MQEYVNVVGEVISIAEHTSYLELVSRVCYYNEPNLNNDMLPYDDTTEEKAKTLINMPVQGKYKVNSNNEPTFSGHEMVKKKDGSIEFKTSSIGTHTDIYIEYDNVDVNGTIKNLPCLFAKYRIWKRYKNVVAAVQRLFNLGKLYSSWEISTYQYIYDHGIRKITDYEFLANCLLGFEFAYPSYGTSANALSMAQLNDNQMMIAEALSQDLIEEIDNKDKEENELMAEKNDSVTPEDVENNSIENVAEENKTEVKSDISITDSTTSAQLTTYDLRRKVSAACETKLGSWCYVSYLFPNEKEVWCEYGGAQSELDYVKFTYEVDENDAITVSEPEYVKLTVNIAEVNSTIANLNKTIETTKAELDIKNNAIIKASETIQQLKAEISNLTPYKDQVELAEQKRIEAEIEKEKDDLRNKLLKGNLFSEKEIRKTEIAELIEARDSSAINNLIADRFVASFDEKDKDIIHQTDVAESKDTIDEYPATNLETDDVETDIRSFMRDILFK